MSIISVMRLTKVSLLVMAALGCTDEGVNPKDSRLRSASSDQAKAEEGDLTNEDVKTEESNTEANVSEHEPSTAEEDLNSEAVPEAVSETDTDMKGGASDKVPGEPTEAMPKESGVPANARVVVLGIDGFGSENVWRQTKDGIRAPVVTNLNKIRNGGLSTLKAVIDEYNYSGPNWAGIVTGSRSAKHGVRTNECDRGNKLPTIYDILKKQRPASTSAIIHEWEMISCYPAPGIVAKAIKTSKAEATANEVIKYWQGGPPDFLFVHFDEVDHAGHADGGTSEHYVETVEQVDQAIGRIHAAINASPQGPSTYLIVVSDHGMGEGGDHAKNTAPVPLFIVGPGLRQAEFTEKVYNYHVAPFAAYLLGLEAPAQWDVTAEPLSKVIKK